MADFSAFQLKESWPYGGDSFTLRIFWTQTWIDDEDAVHLAGTPGLGSPCKICPGTLAGTVGTVESFSFSPTVTSDRKRVRGIGVLFDQDGRMRDVLFEASQFPDADPLTYRFFRTYNSGCVKRLADKYLNRDQILGLFAEFIGSVLAASRVVLGSVYLSRDPADATHPEALGSNDERVPANGDQVDAMAGTNGVPSAANLFVTDSDPRLLADSGRQALVSGTATILSASVAALSNIMAFAQDGNTSGELHVENLVNGVSFDVVSNNGGDTGVIYWELKN